MRKLTSALWLVALAAPLAGCEAERHMSQTHGRAYRAAFALQPVNPKGTPPGAPTMLDSQEAAALAAVYRKSLLPAQSRQELPPVIIVSPEEAQNRVPPPSVPK